MKTKTPAPVVRDKKVRAQVDALLARSKAWWEGRAEISLLHFHATDKTTFDAAMARQSAYEKEGEQLAWVLFCTVGEDVK